MDNFGYEEGQTCWRNGCQGVIKEKGVENCSCHICAPCGACTTHREYCPECVWSAEEEERSFQINDIRCVAVSKDDAKLGMWAGEPLMKIKPRELDPRKIDWHSKPHTNSTMVKEGVYPLGTSMEAIRGLVNGTFGGRFESYGAGKFRFIAYTD